MGNINMAGRPTDYKEEYNELLINHMAEGYSFESFAGLIGTCKQTLYNWIETHPEFLDSKRKGFETSRYFWEGIGIKQAKTGVGNATAFVFNMKNRFPEEWREKIETENTHEVKAFDIKEQLGFDQG